MSNEARRTLVHRAAIEACALRERVWSRTPITESVAPLRALLDRRGTEALEVLAHAIEGEARLHAAGRAVIMRTLTRLVEQRCLLSQEPDAREPSPRAPIVILGLPRSGTTYLHRALGMRGRLRTLRYWETMEPAHRMGRWPASLIEARHALQLAAFRRVDPAIDRMHAVRAGSPEECGGLLKVSLETEQFFATLTVPSYLAWTRSRDATFTYALHAKMRRQLSRRAGEGWLLKSPFHLARLDALRAVYPSARFVVIERDERAALPSRIALITRLRRLISDVPSDEVARDVSEWSIEMRGALERTRDLSRDTALHVRAEDLRRDEARTIRRVEEFIATTENGLTL